MAVETPGAFNENSTYTAPQARRAWFFGLASTGGVKGGTDLAVTTGGGMSVNVASGEVIVPSYVANGGQYYCLNSTTTNLVIATASGSNPRIDTVVASVDDTQNGAGTDDWKLQVITGTPTSGATLTNLSGKGTVPNSGGTSSVLVAYVLVPTSASSIITADLLDARPHAYLANPGPFQAIPASGSGTVTAASGQHYIVSSGNTPFTLPVPFSGARLKFTNYGTGSPVISQNASEKIFGPGQGASGGTSFTLPPSGSSFTIESDGTSWYVTSLAEAILSASLGQTGDGTIQTTASTTYVTLNSGPALSLVTGTLVLVTLTASHQGTVGGAGLYTGFAISGATTTAAADANASQFLPFSANISGQFSVSFPVAVTAGSNTFTMRYRVDSGTGTFTNRYLVVQRMN